MRHRLPASAQTCYQEIARIDPCFHEAETMRAVLDQRLFLTLAAICLAVLLSACGRPPELIGIDNPQIPTASVSDVTRHRIFITTTREPSERPGAFLSENRARELGLASVEVTIPPTHVLGDLERPRRLPPDPRTDFTAVDPVTYDDNRAFIAAIDRELLRRPASKRSVLLFVHGFNNTPTDALLRVAQFVEDSNFEGVPVLLTWASAARSLRYVYDLNSALIAREKIPEIADTLTRTKATSVDVFAHSMGTLLAMEGLVERQRTGRLGKAKRLNTIMLAAPDIDIDLFRTQLGQLSPEVRSAIFLLISERDPALRLSSRIAGGVPRVGAAPLQELEEFGVTVIDLSEISDSTSGDHSKFAGSPEVVQLIGAGLNSASRFGDDTSPTIDQILRKSPIRIFREGAFGGG